MESLIAWVAILLPVPITIVIYRINLLFVSDSFSKDKLKSLKNLYILLGVLFFSLYYLTIMLTAR